MAARQKEILNRITVTPLAGTLGAEISGVDLTEPLDDETFGEIHQALLDHLVIFFRDQAITPEQQIAFGQRFGKLHIHPFIPTLEGYQEVIRLESSDAGPGEMAYQSNTWHTDLTYEARPPMASILHGIEIPAAGGDTMWNNLYAAYDGLSPQMRAFVDGLTAVHNIVASMPPDFMAQSWAPKQLERLQQKTPPVEHPVVRTHPETGRRCLFVNRNFTSHIKALTRAESNALLSFLYEHVEQPEYVVRFKWQKNSLAMWDNRCTQHYALVDYQSKRIMHRVTVCGEATH
ncbi:MAG: taurine dioxygenase [Gammaproteobacteria bacterium]